MRLSWHQGERIDIVIISENEDKDFVYNLIDNYFNNIIDAYPSSASVTIPYGSFIWMRYPNNSIVWNAFDLPPYYLDSSDSCSFTMRTSLLIADLYDADSSYEENVLNISIFLIVKMIKRSSFGLINKYDDVRDVGNNENCLDIIKSYWEFEETDENLILWLEHIEKVYKKEGIKGVHFLISIIFSQLDLSGSQKKHIFYLLDFSRKMIQ
ncbi:hypothetical protein LJC57_05995 [Parabacteroides sp. OttesenSCG-928-G07]|nr:hypothetical protein [Parabacteroides sp. OttesenSCG-928-G07]